jgi:carbonic anhydrase
MNHSRRGFVSSLGIIIAGASAGSALEESAWAATPAQQHEEHSKLPMTTHASGNAEDMHAASEQVWAKLLEGNQRFVAGKPLVRDLIARRSAVLSGQQPQAVVLGCSDSRIPPTQIFDQDLGDLFEVRTVGNVVDAVGMGSMEYALVHLPVRVLVILGHERCGIVKAAAAGDKMPTPNLRATVDKISPALAKLQGDRKSPEFLRKAEIANVVQCAADLLANSPIVLRETAASNVQIIKAMYSLKTGKVTRLAD